MLKFIHAADVHLDSPLRGLDRYDGAPVDSIRGATREALKNLVRLAIDERVAFVLVAGDLYDGDWKDYNTGLFLAHQMSVLRQAGIPVFVINGNHDAASQISHQLALPDNVHVFPSDEPTTRKVGRVAIHAQSFSRREVRDDLSAGYPPPCPDHFNIGLLHTSADGREGHEPYAPCRVENLVAKGYDYWALGHVHHREVLHENPWVVFPGNIQGRHVRETGEKGCTLVRVEDGCIAAVEHRALDVLRWSCCAVDAAGLDDMDSVLDSVESALRRELGEADGRPLALRLRVHGRSGSHLEIAASPEQWTQQIRALCTDLSGGRAWLEKLEWRTRAPLERQTVREEDDVLGSLFESLREIRSSDDALLELAGDEQLIHLRRKLPVELTEGALFASGDAGDPARLGLEDPQALREVLDEVENLLLPRLLGSEETKS